MPSKPILVFPSPSTETRTKRRPGHPGFVGPDIARQATRIGPRLDQLNASFRAETARLAQTIDGALPETVLVLEIVGKIDEFFRAVEKTEGMTFLLAYRGDLMEPDDDFYIPDEEGNKTDTDIDRRIFLILSNQQALQQLLRYWNTYQESRKFDRGTTKFRTLFEQLRDIRLYNVDDRLRDTGFREYITECRALNLPDVHFEIELVMKATAEGRSKTIEDLRGIIAQHNGRLIDESHLAIPEIGFHGIVAVAPITLFDDLSINTNVLLLQFHQILFFRPVGQSIFTADETISTFEADLPTTPLPSRQEPIAALLDGMPLENHITLRDRLIVDDPDGFAATYPAGYRFHATTMASIIVHGDTTHPTAAISSRLYVRPIMKPVATLHGAVESLPSDRLVHDLVLRSVKRLFEGEGGNPAVAPSIRIINISLGDLNRQLIQNVSSWARLLDWLSYKYNVLFMVSSGNCPDNLQLDIPNGNIGTISPDDIQNKSLSAFISILQKRRIISPAESINALTVGSSHSDKSTYTSVVPRRFSVLTSDGFFSPISRNGLGYRQSVKPDVLMPGGVVLYGTMPVQTDPTKTILKMANDKLSDIPPGVRAAAPGIPGEINRFAYSVGTSNATALTTRLGIRIHDILEDLNAEVQESRTIPGEYYPVLIKTLLVHAADWPIETNKVKEIIVGNGGNSDKQKKFATAFFGYGLVSEDRSLFCTDQRVTLIGFGKLRIKDEVNAHTYTLPLPPSMAGQAVQKKLIVTLGWLSPVSFKSQPYRMTNLYFDNLKSTPGPISVERDNTDYNTMKRGTIQHDVFVGDKADAYIDGANLVLKINCVEDALGIKPDEDIRYGLAITLEVLNTTAIHIYDEVRARIRPAVQVGITQRT